MSCWLWLILHLLSLAQIEGIVRGSDIAGKLPTKDAIIMWQLVGYPAVTGSTITDADGHFTIDIQV